MHQFLSFGRSVAGGLRKRLSAGFINHYNRGDGRRQDRNYIP
jgi:hypothetical protein